MSKSQIVKRAVYQHPLLLGYYLNNPEFNNLLTHQIMKGLVPFSCGIEIECMGSLFSTKRNEIKPNSTLRETLKEKFDVLDYDEDIGSMAVEEGFKEHYNEHKIRISDYRQLPGLYKILEEMKVHCQELKQGGLHIHVNAPFIYRDVLNMFKVKEHLKRDLPHLLREFEYRGMQDKEVRIDLKGSCINMRTDLKTVEFRMGYCTFDYEKIVKWLILACSEVKRIRKSLNIRRK